MIISLLKIYAAAVLILISNPVFASTNLDCMDRPLGETEQTLLNRHIGSRGDNKRTQVVQILVMSRAHTCAYLNAWSSNSKNLAFWYKWSDIQIGWLPSDFCADEEQRLVVALESSKFRLFALHSSSVNAIMRGEDSLPPPINDTRYREFYGLLKVAKIPQTVRNEEYLSHWLYSYGLEAAVVAAFLAN